ncbi:DUF406 family protein, partial [Klebsiella pneumoniae]
QAQYIRASGTGRCIVAAGDAVKLDLSIAFSCQAEKIIFELSLRNLL